MCERGDHQTSLSDVQGIRSAPALPEQRRIVGILDEAFEGIADAKANAEKNLKHARALFESYLQSVFANCGEGWTEAVGDVGDVMAGSTPKTVDGGVR